MPAEPRPAGPARALPGQRLSSAPPRAGIPSGAVTAPDGATRRGGLRAWWIWSVAASFYLYEFLVRVAPSVMERALQERFGLSSAALGAADGTYFYVYAPMQIAVGLLLDRFGVKRCLAPAAALCGLACFGVLASDRALGLVLARGLMGLGSAFAFVGAMHLATVWFPAHRIALLSGLTTALGMLGAVASQLPLVALVESQGWREAWWACGVLGLAIAAAILLFVPRPPPWERDKHATRAPADDPPTVWRGLGAVLSHPQVWIVASVGAAIYLPLSVVGTLWGDPFVMAVADATPRQAALCISLLYLAWIVGSPLAGWLSDRLGTRRRLLQAAALATALLLALMVAPLPHTPVTLSAVILGLGLVSSPQVLVFVCNIENAPRWAAGTAVAVTNLIVMLVGGALQPVVGSLLDVGAANAPTAAAFRRALALLPAIAVVGFAASLWLRETWSPAHVHAADYQEGD